MAQKLQTQTKVKVDGDEYVIQVYSPTFGFTLYSKLLRLLGEPFVKLFDMFGDLSAIKSIADIDLSTLDTDAIASVLQSLFGNLKDEDLVPLLLEILSSTFFSPSLQQINEATFNVHFAGRYLHVFKLVGKTLGVQYADFLSGIVKRAKDEKAVSALKAVKTSQS